jgi:hypothetical protein
VAIRAPYVSTTTIPGDPSRECPRGYDSPSISAPTAHTGMLLVGIRCAPPVLQSGMHHMNNESCAQHKPSSKSTFNSFWSLDQRNYTTVILLVCNEDHLLRCSLSGGSGAIQAGGGSSKVALHMCHD